ncbi:MAG TPA: POTRA domain-containing protein [Vicinamibacterales bacterium]|nr:POTRA domain-containing protein [Vicinamibacterales bacterium]
MWLVFALILFAQPREVVTEIQVHGNLVTSDAELRAMTGVEIGAPFEPAMLDEIAARLRATKRFDRVQVLKRFASIADPSQIVLVVIVDEGRVKIVKSRDPDHPYRAVRNHWPRLMYAPIFNVSDRYGVTYGVRVALPDRLGPDSRVIVPFAWGGEKQAGVDFDKTRVGGLFNRIRGGVDWSRRTHPVFDQAIDHESANVRGEHWFRPQLRVGVSGGVEHYTFGAERDTFPQVAIDAVVDTRVDPALPRNAVFGRVAWTHLAGGAVTDLDGRAYVGVVGQLILGVRGQRTSADPALPVYLKPIFGGAANVRGFSPGTVVGDTLTATSAEAILPLTAAVRFVRMGVSAFADAGAVTCGPELPACDEAWKRGFGGSVWFTATVFRLDVAVAHGVGASTRVIVGGNVSF